MSKESRVATKYREIAAPYIRVKRISMILFSIFLIPSIICLIGFLFVLSARRFLAIGFVVCFIPYMIFLVINEKYEKKTRKPEMIFHQIEEYVSELKLTDALIDDFDGILEDIQKGICTMKIDDVLITITENLVVRYEETKTLIFITAAKKSDVNEITFAKYEDKGIALYHLYDDRGCDVDICFNIEVHPDGIKNVNTMLESYFPNMKIKEISSVDSEY